MFPVLPVLPGFVLGYYMPYRKYYVTRSSSLIYPKNVSFITHSYYILIITPLSSQTWFSHPSAGLQQLLSGGNSYCLTAILFLRTVYYVPCIPNAGQEPDKESTAHRKIRSTGAVTVDAKRPLRCRQRSSRLKQSLLVVYSFILMELLHLCQVFLR